MWSHGVNKYACAKPGKRFCLINSFASTGSEVNSSSADVVTWCKQIGPVSRPGKRFGLINSFTYTGSEVNSRSADVFTWCKQIQVHY